MYDNDSGGKSELRIYATDKDIDENGRVSYRWQDPASLEATFFDLNDTNGLVTLIKKFNRSQTNHYNVWQEFFHSIYT